MAAMHATAVFRHSRSDALLVLAALIHGVVLLLWPSVILIALGLWWCANTVSHNFVHLQFFRSPPANRLFSMYLSLLLGLPQTLWQQRHLAHHAGQPWRWRVNGQLLAEFACVGTLWIGLIAFAPRFLVAGYLPGWLLGLALCQLQGYYEHARGTTSHYGWLYNLLLFNDGFHVEHHRRPARHWTRLPQDRDRTAHASRWPAVLRWLDWFSLEGLERCVLRLRWLQPFVIGVHERALDKLVSKLSPPKRVAVVGGALFPRTALALQRLLPNARVVIIDSNYENIVEAKRFLNGHAQYEHRTFRSTSAADEFDLVIIPLSFRGDRDALYAAPPARALLVHDWVWRRRGTCGAVVSIWLLKRVNLVLR